MSTQYIHIKSQDCQYLNNSTSSIQFTLTEPIFRKDTEIFEISLISCVIPYSWYLVNDRNNEIDIIEYDGETQYNAIINLTNGNYNIREIAVILETELNNNTQNETVYSVEFSKYTNKLTISTETPNKRTTFDFYWSYELLGFNYWETYEMTTETPLISSNICNIYTDDNLYIRSNLNNTLSIESQTKSATNILQKVEIQASQGSYIYLNNYITPLISDIGKINSISLYITDEWGETISLNGLNWSCSLRIDKISQLQETYIQKKIKQNEENN